MPNWNNWTGCSVKVHKDFTSSDTESQIYRKPPIHYTLTKKGSQLLWFNKTSLTESMAISKIQMIPSYKINLAMSPFYLT